MDVSYFIEFVNFEEQSIQLAIDTLNQPAIDPADAIEPYLEGSESPVILESVEVDDDKTKVIKGRRLTCGFNSSDPVPFTGGTTLANDVNTFSDGDEDDFRVQLNISSGPGTIPFVGNLILDDNTEAFQPRPNPVRLFASEGLGSLKDIKLRDGEDVPVGHYTLIEYIYMCLNNIRTGTNVYVAMNLFEKIRFRKLSANFNITATNKFRIPYDELGFLEIGDTIEITGSTLGNDGSYTITNITVNGTTSIDIEVSTSTFTLETTEVWIFRSNGHTFSDIYLDATTFETDVNERDDCYTVLNKILDAYGCFITYDTIGPIGGWYIIRWDEYDLATTGATTLKFANYIYSSSPVFVNYSNVDADRIIAHDGDPSYDGCSLSQDSAVKRFQRRAKSVSHTYNYELPKEIPCNSAFLRGELSVTQPVDPLEKNYDYECWTMYKGFPPITNNGTSYIRTVTNSLGNESDRYLLFEVQPDFSDVYYVISEPFFVNEGDRVNISCDVKHNGQVETLDTGFSYPVMAVQLYGEDNTYYRLDGGSLVRNGGTWNTFDSDFSPGSGTNGGIDRIFNGTYDDTTYDNVTLQGADYSNPIPKTGYIRIVLLQAYRANQYETHISNLKVEYFPLINGSYTNLTGQEVKVNDSSNSRKNIEHEMFISDSPIRLFKGALKKYDGTNYVLTETWNYYHDPTILTDTTLAKHIVFQWWNQFRSTRTVIETDVQGLGTSATVGPPGMVYRWKILHGDQEDKKFMLTSFRNMDFRTCGWSGVFVENSSTDGDRDYTDDFSFKYIQE